MKNYKNYLKYADGFLIGMISEYLYRVKFDIIPFIILILFTVSVVIRELYEKSEY